MLTKALSMSIEKLYNLADKLHSSRLKKFYSQYNYDLVVDVGSHKGEFLTSIIDDLSVPIICFEPQSAIRTELLQKINHLNVEKCYDYAVSDFVGEIELKLNNLTSTSSTKKAITKNFWMKFKRMVLGGALYSGTELVKVSTLDQLIFENIQKNTRVLLKIDVEGAELDVLKGAQRCLMTLNIMHIQIEAARYNIYENVDVSDVKKLLKTFGFEPAKTFTFPLQNFQDVIYSRSE